jgi:archaellum component FlaC
MTELTLISHEDIALQPLIEGAISEALRSTQSGIDRCQARIKTFEQEYSMTSAVFLQRYENDELQETLELDEWIGEIRMVQRLQEKVIRLRGVEFVH